MPCYQHKAKPVSHNEATAPSKACCTHPADESSGIGSGCDFDQRNLALNFQREPIRPPPRKYSGLDMGNKPHGPVWPTARLADLLEPLKAPIYLRIRILLI